MQTLELQKTATQVRRDIVRMVHGVQSGHPGGSLGCADVVTALYFHTMKHDVAFTMDGKGEDLFFLSNGHISPLYYSVLARAGYFEVKELTSFRKINTRLQGHPTTHEHLHGDGELQEGQIWEAVMFAAHHKVDNLISIVDVNGQQIDGPTSKVMSLGNLRSKFEAFDWTVLEMDGNQMEDVVATLDKAKSMTGEGKPICILMKTEMGKGVDFMEGSHEWHGIAPSDEQLAKALGQLEET